MLNHESLLDMYTMYVYYNTVCVYVCVCVCVCVCVYVCVFQSHPRLPLSSANRHGYFNNELIPMEVKGKKGVESFTVDEHPRETTLEKLAKLPPVFKENGAVSAGNASVSSS